MRKDFAMRGSASGMIFCCPDNYRRAKDSLFGGTENCLSAVFDLFGCIYLNTIASLCTNSVCIERHKKRSVGRAG